MLRDDASIVPPSLWTHREFDRGYAINGCGKWDWRTSLFICPNSLTVELPRKGECEFESHKGQKTCSVFVQSRETDKVLIKHAENHGSNICLGYQALVLCTYKKDSEVGGAKSSNSSFYMGMYVGSQRRNDDNISEIRLIANGWFVIRVGGANPPVSTNIICRDTQEIIKTGGER